LKMLSRAILGHRLFKPIDVSQRTIPVDPADLAQSSDLRRPNAMNFGQAEWKSRMGGFPKR
jgi:hypothetical protein